MSADDTYAPKSPDLSSFYSTGPTAPPPHQQPQQPQHAQHAQHSSQHSQHPQQHQPQPPQHHQMYDQSSLAPPAYPAPAAAPLHYKQEPHYPLAVKSEYPSYPPPAHAHAHAHSHAHAQAHQQYLPAQQLHPASLPPQEQPPYPAAYGPQGPQGPQYLPQQQTFQADAYDHPPPQPYGAPPAFYDPHHPHAFPQQAVHPHLPQQQQQQQQPHHPQYPQAQLPGSALGPAAAMPPRKSAQAVSPPPPFIDTSPVRTKFPTARIKRIMQADEEVGKVAQQTPIAVGKALELFMVALVSKSADVAKEKNSKRVTAQMLKQVIETDSQWDFLADIAAKVGDEKEGKGGRSSTKAESESDEEVVEPKKKAKGGRKKKI